MGLGEIMIVGIDPGCTGAIVALSGGSEILFKTLMPKAGAGLIDVPGLAAVFRTQLKECHVVLEQAQSFPKQGVASSFNYGRGFGSIEGVLGSLGIPYTLVRPHVWTRELHQGLPKEQAPKEKSLIVVKRLFPSEDLRASTRCKNFHEGYVDAVLIAEWGRRNLH